MGRSRAASSVASTPPQSASILNLKTSEMKVTPAPLSRPGVWPSTMEVPDVDQLFPTDDAGVHIPADIEPLDPEKYAQYRADCLAPMMTPHSAYTAGCRCRGCYMFHSASSYRYKRGFVGQCAAEGCLEPKRRVSGARYCEEHATSKAYKPTGWSHYKPINCDLCGRQAKITTKATYRICSNCSEPHRGLITQARSHGVPWARLAVWLASPKCELCARQLYTGKGKGGSGGFAIDHNHSCCPGGNGCAKCVRGLLCGACNTRLGSLEAMLRVVSIPSLMAYLGRGSDDQLNGHRPDYPDAA